MRLSLKRRFFICSIMIRRSDDPPDLCISNLFCLFFEFVLCMLFFRCVLTTENARFRKPHALFTRILSFFLRRAGCCFLGGLVCGGLVSAGLFDVGWFGQWVLLKKEPVE